MYNETVLDHFINPKNAGAMADADASGQTGNPADGDKIKIFIRVSDGRLERVQFQTFGCAAAIAASSMLTVLATGKTLEEAANLTNRDVAEALGELPAEKLACSNIAAFALHEAIANYRERIISAEHDEPVGDSCAFSHEGLEPTQRVNLSPDQAQRYLRQLIIPQIQGQGQAKLLGSYVRIVAEGVADVALMVFYLAAMGIGRITCRFSEDSKRAKQVLDHARDINPDLAITQNDQGGTPDITVFFGGTHELTQAEDVTRAHQLHAILGDWRGLVTDHAPTPEESMTVTSASTRAGKAVSSAFAGTLLAIEIAKRIIGIGERIPSRYLSRKLSCFLLDFFCANRIKSDIIYVIPVFNLS